MNNLAVVKRVTITVEEAARILGVSRGSAYEAVHRGEIPTIRIGKRLVVPVAALERMLGAEPTGAEPLAVVKGWVHEDDLYTNERLRVEVGRHRQINIYGEVERGKPVTVTITERHE